MTIITDNDPSVPGGRGGGHWTRRGWDGEAGGFLSGLPNLSVLICRKETVLDRIGGDQVFLSGGCT